MISAKDAGLPVIPKALIRTLIIWLPNTANPQGDVELCQRSMTPIAHAIEILIICPSVS